MVSRLGSVSRNHREKAPPRGTRPLPLEAAHSEIEAKFLIEDAALVGHLIDSLDSYDVRSASAVDIVDDYWDTPGWHLFRAGWAYRWRDRSGDRIMTLKSFGLRDGIVQRRQEIELRRSRRSRRTAVTLWSTEHFAGRSGGVRSGDLRELFRVQTHRRLYDIRLSDDDASVQLGIDRDDHHHRRPGQEAGAGPHDVPGAGDRAEGGSGGVAAAAGRRRRSNGSASCPPASASSNGDCRPPGLSPPRASGVVLPASTPFLQALRERAPAPADPAIHLAYGRLLAQFEEMIIQEPRAWEGLDPEGVHKMRVATRRLRSALRAFKKVLPASVCSFNGEFKWLAAALGGVRDLDVAMGNLPGFLSEIPPGGCRAPGRLPAVSGRSVAGGARTPAGLSEFRKVRAFEDGLCAAS